MLSRQVKATYYALFAPLMRANAAVYKSFRAPVRDAKAHLGPGQERYIPGWINVDANKFTGKCDVWTDLRYGLPFRSNSLKCAYSHHVVEHLPDLAGHFKEAYRCLQPGGVYRVGGPNGDSGIKKFLEGDINWFSDFPQTRRSIGGRFENFVFCKGEHLTILTESFMSELLEDAGFIDIRVRAPIEDTGYPELFGDAMAFEHEGDPSCPRTLLLEAAKPN